MTLSLFKVYSNYETLKKFILFKFTYDNSENTLEESYVLKEIRADHKLFSKRLFMISIATKMIFVVQIGKMCLPYVPGW